MSELIQKPKSSIEFSEDLEPVFYNYCAIQCGTFSMPMFNSKFTSNEKIVRFVNYKENDTEQFVNVEAFPKLGLPTTSDLAFYLVFQKFLDEEYKFLRSSDDQIYFSQYDLLKKTGLSTDGYGNFERIRVWGQRMKETAIRFFVNEERKQEKMATLNIFQEFITKGVRLENGDIADGNWLRLSKWELDNRLNYPLVPLDLKSYLKISDPKSQLLIPHLQVWLYASQNSKVFRKNYREICSLLGLKPHKHYSPIVRQFGNTFKFLINEQYLSAAKIYKSKSDGEFIIELKHGEKFLSNMKTFTLLAGGVTGELPEETQESGESSEKPSDEKPDLHLLQGKTEKSIFSENERSALDLMLSKGIDREDAEQILTKRSLTEIAQIIRYCEHLFETAPEKYHSRCGYIFSLLNKDSYKVPQEFEKELEKKNVKHLQIVKQQKKFDLEEREHRKRIWIKVKFKEFCAAEARRHNPPDAQKFSERYAEGLNIWKQILPIVEKNIGPLYYGAWFNNVVFVNYEETTGTFFLAASHVTADWIRMNYQSQLDDAARVLNNDGYEFSWLIQDDNNESSGKTVEPYDLFLIEKFKSESGMTAESFYEENQSELDKEFDSIDF